MNMKISATIATALISVGGLSVHASTTLSKASGGYANAIGLVEAVRVLSDKQIGTVKVASLDNGPAANPVTFYVMLLSRDQRGDNANFDVYGVHGSYNDAVRTAEIQGDNLVLTTIQSVPDGSRDGWHEVDKTIRIQIKKNGKRLIRPIQA